MECIEFIVDKIRVQLISNEVIRLECNKYRKFFDADSFLIPNRSSLIKKVDFSKYEDDLYFYIKVGEFTISILKNNSSLKDVKIYDSEKNDLVKFNHLKNIGELPPLNKTPKVFILSDSPHIVVPKNGYTANMPKRAKYTITKNVKDVYLLLCNHDFIKLRKLYIELTGRSEMIRLANFGLWDSRYYKYTQKEAEQRILDYQKYDIPLDNFVVDTDWRKSNDTGIGYDINEELFPDMDGFFKFAHSHNLEIMFNDHPEPLKGAKSLIDIEEIKFREEKLTNILKMGLDTWWYDRNWFTKLISPVESIEPETWGMYLFQDITRHFYQKKANDNQVYRRPVIMGNVNNIKNGAYFPNDKNKKLYIRDSASHRYSIQWTGDIQSTLESLGSEINNMVYLGNNLVAYANSDCGGHFGNSDSETYIRWMQYGTFSPIFRPHCTIGLERSREPWAYDEKTLSIVRNYIKLRYRLLPLIYKSSYENYLTGQPIFKSMGYNYPNDLIALKNTNQYMLGNDLLIAPIAKFIDKGPKREGLYSRNVYFPKGKWISLFHRGKTIFNGEEYFNVKCLIEEMPLFVRAGSLIPLSFESKNSKDQNWGELFFDYYPCFGQEDEGYIYEDDFETTAYKFNKNCISKYNSKFDEKNNCYIITFDKSEGEIYHQKRDITLRINEIDSNKIKLIEINDVLLRYKSYKADKTSFPLDSSTKSTFISRICKFQKKADEIVKIKIYMK